ncbi:MAG TPA: carbonic anhydrase [Holophagaceae bacterium]
MRGSPLLLILASFSLPAPGGPPAPSHPPVQTHPAYAGDPSTPEAARLELAAGNARFVACRRVRTVETGRDAALRTSLVKGQHPFAVIVTCSDSRVPDNLVFDQEGGRLFTLREAGNAPDLQGLASVEYAVEHLGSKLVVVMGHTGCGAVKAVREARGNPLPGHLWAFQAAMAGLLASTPEGPHEDPGAHAARLEIANARRQAQALLDRSDLLRRQADRGQLRVLPAIYHLDSGRVDFLEPATPLADSSHP